jgi:uncharacterized membrane protein
MNLRRFYRVAAIVVAAQLLLAVWGLAQVGPSARVPIHWNAAGQPNGYGPAWLAFLLGPVITVALVGLFAVIPRVEPRRANLLRSSSAYLTIAFASLVLTSGLEAATVLVGVGYGVPITLLVGGGVGLLLAVMGNVMATVRSNFLVGVRTPWTLTSDLAWDKTHRLIGRLWVLGGVAMFMISLFGQGELLFGAVIAFVVGTVVVAVAYSYLVWRTDPDKHSLGGRV